MRAVVEVALQPPSLPVARLDDSRARRAQLRELSAQLRLEAFVLQREAGRSADGLEEAGLVEEVAIVHEHGEPVADVGDGAGVVGGEIELASLVVSPHAAVGQPEPEDERRIAQRPRQRGSNLPGLDLTELDDQVRHDERARRVSPRPNAAAAAESPIGTYQTYRNQPS